MLLHCRSRICGPGAAFCEPPAGKASPTARVGPHMQTQIFSDLASPWCYLAMTRLERAAGVFALRTGEPVELALRACQPAGRPADQPKHGGDAVAGDTDRLREAFAQDRLALDLDVAVTADMFDAHRLLSWAEAVGGGPTQLALAFELWRAACAEGADLADHTTLANRAALAGLDLGAAERMLASGECAAEVRLQRDTAQALGIITVPTVVCERTYVVTGAQTQQTYEQVLDKVRGARGRESPR